MMFMNDSDILCAAQRAICLPYETPNLRVAILALSNLVEWTNNNSDGWAYWPKPARAAATLMRTIDSATNPQRHGQHRDITDVELKCALRPVKAFLTRQEVAHALLVAP